MISDFSNDFNFNYIYNESVSKPPKRKNLFQQIALGTYSFLQNFVENIPYDKSHFLSKNAECHKEDAIMNEYENVLENGFEFEGGYVVEAFYYPEAKQIWFVLNDINYEIRRNFTKKALDTWESFGGEIIPLTTSVARFKKELMPGGAIRLKVGQ